MLGDDTMDQSDTEDIKDAIFSRVQEGWHLSENLKDVWG